jgi:hypothetical protein
MSSFLTGFSSLLKENHSLSGELGTFSPTLMNIFDSLYPLKVKYNTKMETTILRIKIEIVNFC